MLKLKGRKLYDETGAVYAEVTGWRSRADHRNTNFKVTFADGRTQSGWCYFADAVADVRADYNLATHRPSCACDGCAPTL